MTSKFIQTVTNQTIKPLNIFFVTLHSISESQIHDFIKVYTLSLENPSENNLQTFVAIKRIKYLL